MKNNWKMYKSELQELVVEHMAVDRKGRIKNCKDMPCPECIFYIEHVHKDYCSEVKKYEWLESENKFRPNKKIAYTNCGSQMVDMLEEEFTLNVEYVRACTNYYHNQFIDWLEKKRQRQINFDLENDSFGRLLTEIRQPNQDELEDLFQENKE